MPIRTPITTAPARAPSGLRRAMFSNSATTVLAWSVAAEAAFAPFSARSLAAVLTCPATAVFAAQVWRDARGFWGPRGSGSAWVMSGLTLLTVLANLAALYGMNVWNRALFDGLERHEASRVLAALDPQSQDKLMDKLIRKPARTTVISVGHRPELESYHDRKITLERRRGSTRLWWRTNPVSLPNVLANSGFPARRLP